MLIDYYDFNKEGQLYYRPNVGTSIIDSLKSVVADSEKRVAGFWGNFTAKPKIIYCHSEADYRKFGNPAMTPAVAFMSLGSYIVIHPTGLNVDVVAHELSHTELFSRIGFFNRERKIPVWFDEGLAMQVDWRSNYSTDSLKVWSNNFEELPDVVNMKNYSQFSQGNITRNYSAAKYVVGQWYSPENLDRFLEVIDNGGVFDDAMDTE